MLGLFYLRLVLSRWRLVLGLVLGGLGAALLVTLYMAQQPKFEAASRLNIVPTSEELGYANRFVRGSTFDGGSTLLQTYAEFAHTRPVVTPIVDRWVKEQAAAAGKSEAAWIAENSQPPSFSPGRILSILNYGAAPVVPLKQDIVDGLIEHTTIETVEGTYLLRIAVEWDDPVAAAWFANALADAIIARAERMSSRTGTEIAGSLQTRLAEKQAELDAVLRRSRDTKQAVGVVDVDQQKQSLLAAQISEQSQLTSDRAALQASQSQVAGLRRQSGGKMSTAQAAIDQTLAVEGPKAAGLARGIAIREGRVAQIRSQIAALGRHEDTIRSLDDRAQQLRAEVAALTERVSFSQTENLANAPRIQLIERATPPLTRSSPKMLLNLALGFVAGCALAGIALLLLGPAPVRDREGEEETPAAEPSFARDHAPEPAAAAAGPAPGIAHPRRRWSDFVPGGGGNVVEMPRAAPSPAFATTGSLALARDLDAPVPVLPVQPEPARGGTHFDRLGANGDGVALSQEPVRPEPVEGPPEPVEADEVPEEVRDVEVMPVASPPEPTSIDPVFGYLLPPPRDGRRYDAAEVRGIGAQIATWLGEALTADRPLTVAAVANESGAQRLYQLLHDWRAATGAPVRTVDWSAGARALPRGAGKPLIYAGGGFGAGTILAHSDGAIVVAVAADDEAALAAEARRLATFAGRPVHVVPLGD